MALIPSEVPASNRPNAVDSDETISSDEQEVVDNLVSDQGGALFNLPVGLRIEEPLDLQGSQNAVSDRYASRSRTASWARVNIKRVLRSLARWGPLSRARVAVDGRMMTALLPPLVRRWSHDATQQLTASRLLVLAPHPDDETIGCGATVARTLTGGGEVLVVTATDGRLARMDGDPDVMAATRRRELAAAAEVLGLTPLQVRTLDFPDRDLNGHEMALTDSLATVIRSWQPSVVLVTGVCDPNPDHAALGRAARRAMAGQSGALFEYMVWGWVKPTLWLLGSLGYSNHGRGAARANHAVTVQTEGFLSTKRQALSCHQSQLGPSAPAVGLPAGDGALNAEFLANFLGSFEVFFPVNAEAQRLAGIPARHGWSGRREA